MGLVATILWLTGRAVACDDAEARIDEALEHIVQADLPGASSALAAAEAAFACATVPPVALARYWLVEGALAAFAGHDEDADEAFRAAARAEPETWLVDLGADLLERREAAVAAVPPNGGLALADASGYRVLVDARPIALPADIPSGLHLVQVAEGEAVRFGLVVFVLPGQPSLVETGLAPVATPPPPPAPDPEAVRRDGPAVSVAPRVASGASLAFGRALERRTGAGAVVVEPATKALVPLEAGVRVGLGRTWARATAAVAPVLSGRLLWLGDEGIRGTALALEPRLAAGARFPPVDLGATVGVLLPSRVSAGALAAVRVGGSPVLAEARLGANLLAGRPVEPMATVLVAFEPEAPW